MILVDIGNSGIRAMHVGNRSEFRLDSVHRLSWSANLHVRHKESPEQKTAPNQRWCDSGDETAFQWIVNQLYSSVTTGEAWWISSVHQGAMQLLTSAVERKDPLARIRAVSFRDLPISFDLDSPEKTGIDRLLAAWEGWHTVNTGAGIPRAVIVAQAGTALTVDLIAADQTYCGGAILPGLGLSLQLLAAGTDQLPWIGNHSVTDSPALPGKNTLEAIVAGVHASLSGGARFLVERYRQNEAWKNAFAVVTGGDGAILAKQIPAPCLFQEHMILRGLYRLAMRS